MKKTFFLLFVCLTAVSLKAQLSKTHYIPPVFSVDGATIGEYTLFLSTPSDTNFYVKIYEGKALNALDSVKVSSQKSSVYSLGFRRAATGVVGDTARLNKKLKKEGLKLVSEIPFFANIRSHSDLHGSSMTSKGKSGLGTEFRTGHMVSGFDNTDGNWKNCSHFISVMATKNNTEVTFSDIKKGVQFYGLNAEGKNKKTLTTVDHKVKLNKGESYIVSELNKDFQYGDENKSFGTLVKSNRPIAVNVGSATSNAPEGGGWDTGFDQIVPVESVGKEYILIKGEGGNRQERVVVVGTVDNTTVKIAKEEPVVLKAGGYHIINGELFNESGNMTINSDKPIYVYQNFAGADDNRTCGLSFVPPTNSCANSSKLLISDVGYIGNEAVIDIVTKINSEIQIIDTDKNQVLKIFDKSRSNVDDESEWVTYKFKVPSNAKNISIGSDDAINVSMINRSDAIGAASYFSGFTAPPIIKAVGGVASFYSKGSLKLSLKQAKGYSSFKWYRNDKLIKETKGINMEISEYGEYYVIGIDRLCDYKFTSPIFKLTEPKELLVSEEIFEEEEVKEDFEKAIIEEGFDSNVLVNLNFKYNSEELIKASISQLNDMVSILKKYPEVKIKIRAHTDCRGNEDYNLKLSQKRAEFVKSHMVSKGIVSDRLQAEGLGESEPLLMAKCDCDVKDSCTKALHLLNRRSEFVIIK